MPLQTITNTSLSMFNQSWPIWDYGAFVYWNSRNGRVAPTGGTPFRHGDGFLDHSPSSSGDDNIYYDTRKGKFIEYSSAGDAPFPSSGIGIDGAHNRWEGGANAANQRGFTPSGGLTATLPVGTNNREIVELLGGGPADYVTFSNFSGVTQNASATWDIGFAGSYVFSVLVRRSDRGTVGASTCVLECTDGTAADITTAPTRYIRVGDKGWYILYVPISVGGNTVITPRIDVAAGVTGLYVELPGVYEGSIFAGEHPGWIPIETNGSPPHPFRSEHEIAIENVDWTITQGGWYGCTFVPIFPSAGDASTPDSIDYETSVLLNFRLTSSTQERIRLIISDSAEMFRFDYDAFSGGAGTSLTPDVSFFKQGVPVGVVLTWGWRSGTLSYTLFVNGRQVGIHSVAPVAVPVAVTNAELHIGHQDSANASNVSLQQVALGNKRLSRIAGRHLSSWFQRKADYVVDVAGA